MINLKLTKNLLGINIEGDFDDLSELSNSITNLTNLNLDIKDKYETILIILNSFNSNLRSALLGEKDIVLKENGIYDELLLFRNINAPSNNVYFSFNISIIDMLFIMIIGNKLLFISNHNMIYDDDFLKFISDSKVFESFIIKIWDLLKNELKNYKIDSVYSKALLNKEEYEYYLLQYIDKLFIDLYNSSDRINKIYEIINLLIDKTNDYINLYNDLNKIAKDNNIYLEDTTNDYLDSYPNEFEW